MVGRFTSVWLLPVLVTVPILTALPQNTKVHDPHRLIEEADRLAMLYNWPKAAPLYAEAETLFNQSGDSKNALYARLGLAWVRADTGAGPELESQIEKQMETRLVQGDARLMLRCLVTKAAVDHGETETSARDVWEKILQLAKGLGDQRWQARAEAELGIITFMDGDVQKATQMLKTALISTYMLGDLAAAIYYSSMVGNGLVEVDQPEAGLQYCETALKTASTIKDMGFPFMAYEGKARALVALHREAEAKKVLDQALAQARSQGARAAEAQLLIVMGKETAATDPNQAIEYLRAATTLTEQAGFRHALAWGAFELAKVYRDKNDLGKAEQYATEAIGAMREVQDKYHLPMHLSLLADLEVRRGKVAEADRLYDQAADVVEGMLVNVPGREVESSLIATMSELYLGHFVLAATKLKDTDKAYQILELARGRLIADALRSEPTKEARTDSITRAAQRETKRIQLRLLHETDRNERKKLLDRLFNAEQVLTPVSRPRTRLQLAETRAVPVGLTNVQRSLHPDEMILEYVLAEPQSFCLHITRTTSGVSTLPAGRRGIEELVESYLAEIRLRKPGTEAGARLYSLLLQPVPGKEAQSKLIVVPDGQLHLLPFDSLTDSRGRRVVESHVVTCAPSATVLYLIRTSPIPHRPTLIFLGVGDVQYAQEQTLPAEKGNGNHPLLAAAPADPFDLAGARLQGIPESRDEVIAASQVFGRGSRLLLGRDATEAAFKSQPLADFEIIHIAAHGIASTKFPDRAALVLGNDSKRSEDGLLQVREIRSLTLNADLVTLSACETGVGRLLGEEGIANLVRAFLFAGAKSVAASLWSVDDASTELLMKRFYAHLARKESKASALRQAKLDLLDQMGDPPPFFWAGFTLVGDGSAPISF